MTEDGSRSQARRGTPAYCIDWSNYIVRTVCEHGDPLSMMYVLLKPPKTLPNLIPSDRVDLTPPPLVFNLGWFFVIDRLGSS